MIYEHPEKLEADMATISITGYTDKVSVAPGEEVSFQVSVDNASSAQVEIVRLIHGDEHPEGPGFIEEVVPTVLSGEHAVTKQFVDVGNAAVVDDPDNKLGITGPITIYSHIFPTTPGKGRQVILGRFALDETAGYALCINPDGHLAFLVGDGEDTDEITSPIPLMHHTWYFVAASFDPKSGQAAMFQEAVVSPYNGRLGRVAPFDHHAAVEQKLRVKAALPASPFMWAAAHNSASIRGEYKDFLYNGKIDRSGVIGAALSVADLKALKDGTYTGAAHVAQWDTSAGYGEDGIGDVIVDVSPNALHAMGLERPVRAMTGFNWSGKHDDWRVAPSEYGGIEFHDDAVMDCGWDTTFTWKVPEGTRSGAYAARVTIGAVEDHIPFFVRPLKATAPILYLMPTNSYLAYANEMIVHHVPVGQAIMSHPAVLSEAEADYYQDPRFGRSTYDHHNDGAGVCYTSWKRPILNMRPKWRSSAIGTVWQFPRDLSTIGWLEAKGYAYDVATDHDLTRDGVDLLKQYSVVLTGSHPEYWHEQGLNDLEDYVADGGRLMYLGGNGFYWVISYRDGEPEIMEVRKGEAGMRAWQAEPGEYYHATSAERGGIWRNRARPPQKLTGVGFTTQGFDECHPYQRMPDSYHRSVSWIFDGVEGEVFGDFGLALGGAAGLETERYDLELGTPPHTKLLASSTSWSDNYASVHEDILFNHPGTLGTQSETVRADMTYFTTANNGAVFSTGSIAWMSALPSFDFENNVSQIMANVLDAFIKPGALPGGAWDQEEKSWT
jgi:N,N-dimethylformamidase